MKKILIGIQPTGRIHLGNYLGVIKHGLELQKDNEVRFMVAIYHSFTSQSEIEVSVHAGHMFNQLKKLGAKNIYFQQPLSLEVFWKLAAQEPIGPLTHMPQYKSKEKTVGMLTYPILMAADIIVSGCDYVLVGEDQEAHMEYYRELARKHGYEVAKSMKSKSPKIMSIKDPTKKMSKSLGDEHCIYIDDSFETVKAKLKKAPTDEAGIKNLKLIAKSFGYVFDEKNCADSEEKLAQIIVNEFSL